MSPSTTEIVDAVPTSLGSSLVRARRACSLVYAAANVIGDDDHVAKVFLARLMVKVALTLDPDVSPNTQ